MDADDDGAHVEVLGRGAFGEVIRVRDPATGRSLACKRIFTRAAARTHTRARGETVSNAAREVEAHRRLAHPNIVEFIGARAGTNCTEVLLEELAIDLCDVLHTHHTRPDERVARAIIRSVLRGVAHMHATGFMHRDLKPGNIMFSHEGVAKLTDLGLARAIPEHGAATLTAADAEECALTWQVASRWYRAPELLFSSTRYTPSIDLWAVGCILAEVIELTPLFGAASDMMQMAAVFAVLGTPTEASWPAFASMPDADKVLFEPRTHVDWGVVMPHASPLCRDLVSKLVCLDGARRLTAAQALSHPWLEGPEASAAEMQALVANALKVRAEGRRRFSIEDFDEG